MREPVPLYPCDPLKNVNCKKDMCFMWGGECSHTTDPKYARAVPPTEKKVHFGSWEELLKAAHSYVVMGYEVEVKGWNDISNNVLTIRDRWELKQEQKSEWEHDHEILKAYSDGANEILDKIRAEIKQLPYQRIFGKVSSYSLIDAVIEIIDKYKAEQDGSRTKGKTE